MSIRSLLLGGKKKVKVSRNEFADILYRILLLRWNKSAIKKTAGDLSFDIITDENFNKINTKLFILNMWLVVIACEKELDSEDKRNECLDLFHHIVYEEHFKKTEPDFQQWMKDMDVNYVEYSKAMEAKRPAWSPWLVASFFNRNLFGELKKDPIVQMNILQYISLSIEHYGKAIRQYEIE